MLSMLNSNVSHTCPYNMVNFNGLLAAEIFMAAHSNGQAIIFLPCGFFYLLSSIYLFSSPNLSGCRLDVYHISTHGVALVRI